MALVLIVQLLCKLRRLAIRSDSSTALFAHFRPFLRTRNTGHILLTEPQRTASELAHGRSIHTPVPALAVLLAALERRLFQDNAVFSCIPPPRFFPLDSLGLNTDSLRLGHFVWHEYRALGPERLQPQVNRLVSVFARWVQVGRRIEEMRLFQEPLQRQVVFEVVGFVGVWGVVGLRCLFARGLCE